jgi:alpha-beta hydrolase superfamily lysophospholipase
MPIEGQLQSRNGTQLFYRRHPAQGDAKGQVLVIHGFGDHSGRYVALLDSLAAAGLDALAFDLRGHGKSQGVRGHLERFSDYLDDCRAGYAELTKDALGERVVVFGHSMGGLIATHFVAREPEVCKALVLSSPMFERALKVNPLKLLAGQLLGRIVPKLALPTGLSGKHVTHDPQEIALYDEDPLMITNARAGWFLEVEAAMKNVAERIAQITVPLYLMHGEADEVTSFSRSKALFAAARSADKRFVPLAGMRHETIHEVERARVITDVTSWIAEHA